MARDTAMACSISRNPLPCEGKRANYRAPATLRICQEWEGLERYGAGNCLGLGIERSLIVGAEDRVPGGIEVQALRLQRTPGTLHLTVPRSLGRGKPDRALA